MYNNNYYIILLILIIILLINFIFYSYSFKLEQFEDNQKIPVYSTFPGNFNEWIDKSNNTLIQIDYNNLLNPTSTDFYYISDPLDYVSDIKKSKNAILENADLPDGYFIILMNNGTVFSLFDKNTKIGYFDRPDSYFIKSFMYGYRITSVNYELVKMSMDNFNISDVDYVITYVILNSDFHKWIMQQQITIYGFKDIDIDRIKLFYPNISSTSVSLQEILLNNIYYPKATVQNVNCLLPTIKMNIVKFSGSLSLSLSLNSSGGGSGSGSGSGSSSSGGSGGGSSGGSGSRNGNLDTRESFFVTQFVIDNDSIDPDYICQGKNGDMYKTKPLCNSDYGFYGLKKDNEKTIWDKKCKTDDECPFFSSTKNRGGCLPDGNCEFPIGIQKLGFRKYDDTGLNAPFCNGCTDPEDIDCCKKQKIPDYAFR